MFVSAIDTVARFTFPLHVITRMWGDRTVFPGAATIFFVNADGWALTCKHVAGQLQYSDQLLAKHAKFKAERAHLLPGKKSRNALKALTRKYEYSNDVPVEVHLRFMNCGTGHQQVTVRSHPSLDVALLKFSNFTSRGPFAVFAQHGDELKQGQFLCRLGFPFPEFTNFEYDAVSDQARWTTTGRAETPRFPLDGMVTRHLIDPGGIVVGFEVSTPGLRGQSGGPAFDAEGRVWGMQSATNHLDLDFDVDMDVLRKGQKHRVKDSAFLHVGHCVHVNALKQFMRDNGVNFQEAV